MKSKQLRIINIQVTALRQNCRIIVDTMGKIGAIVDPGGDVETILEAVKKEGVNVKYVLLTHAHFDHAGGVGRLLKSLNEMGHKPEFVAHKEEITMRAGVAMQAEMFCTANETFDNCPEPNKYIEDGETLMLGENVKIKALFTPGHSPGHLSFLVSDSKPQCVITGDALFNGSIGRTDLPGSSHETLMTSIKNKLLVLPKEVLVMPGHGPDSNIGDEIEENPFLEGV